MTSTNRTERKAAIVTGAGSGIGRATALLLADAGFDVGMTFHRNASGAGQVVEEIDRRGSRGHAVALDLGDPRRAATAIEDLAERLGRLDVLVNNAGVNPRTPMLEATVEDWEWTLGVNLIGPWACARAAVPHMSSGGRIVNITSVLAFAPLEGGGAYCAAKAGLELLTKVMALELAPRGIAVNAVAPGHTATPMNFPVGQLNGERIDRPVIPFARAADPEEVARVIAFLVAGDASYTTGASVTVDGGLLLASGPQALQVATGLPPEARP
jgi:NAD(P)-dependent dehydrogenase (short-subunit alcohol dehydrogenase family)